MKMIECYYHLNDDEMFSKYWRNCRNIFSAENVGLIKKVYNLSNEYVSLIQEDVSKFNIRLERL